MENSASYLSPILFALICLLYSLLFHRLSNRINADFVKRHLWFSFCAGTLSNVTFLVIGSLVSDMRDPFLAVAIILAEGYAIVACFVLSLLFALSRWSRSK